jgi:hypothetical protein
MRTKVGWLVVVLGATTVSGCAYRASYQARAAAPADETGPPVSTYPIPANDPAGAKGSINVISLGAERLPVPAGQPDTYLHVRLAAENTSDTVPWTLDPNDQLLSQGGTSVPPAFAESSAGGPVLTLNSAGRGYLDVYYPIPATAAPARVSLRWQLQRGEEAVAGATELDRVAGPDPAYAYYQPAGPNVYVGFGLGSWWWPDYYFWHHGPYWWPYPRFWGYRSYWGGHRGYYDRPYWGGGYRGGRGWSSGRGAVAPSGGWNGGGRAAPSRGGDSNKSEWRRR